MHLKYKIIFEGCLVVLLLTHCTQPSPSPIDPNTFAAKYYGADAQWYLDNIPFFECSDTTIEQVYYYRWKFRK